MKYSIMFASITLAITIMLTSIASHNRTACKVIEESDFTYYVQFEENNSLKTGYVKKDNTNIKDTLVYCMKYNIFDVKDYNYSYPFYTQEEIDSINSSVYQQLIEENVEILRRWQEEKEIMDSLRTLHNN